MPEPRPPLDATGLYVLVRLTRAVGDSILEHGADANINDFLLVLHDDLLPQVSEVAGVEVMHSPHVPAGTRGYIFDRSKLGLDYGAAVRDLVRGASPL